MAETEADGSSDVFERYMRLSESAEKIVQRGMVEPHEQEGLQNLLAGLLAFLHSVKVLELISDNEELDEISTKTLKLLTVYVYIGHLYLNLDQGDRKENVHMAVAYLKSFLKLMKSLGVANDVHLENVSESEEEAAAGQARTFEEASRDRTLKIERYNKKMSLQRRLEAMKVDKRIFENEERMRELFLSELRLHTMRAVDELHLAKEELKLLDRISHLDRVMGTVTEPKDLAQSESENRVSASPFFIKVSDTHKKVFGMGYPSVPTQSVDDWLSRRAAIQRSSTAGGQSGVVEAYESGRRVTISEEVQQVSKPREEREDEESDDEEEALKRAREWDDYKDTHPRGSGNTYNMA